MGRSARRKRETTRAQRVPVGEPTTSPPDDDVGEPTYWMSGGNLRVEPDGSLDWIEKGRREGARRRRRMS